MDSITLSSITFLKILSFHSFVYFLLIGLFSTFASRDAKVGIVDNTLKVGWKKQFVYIFYVIFGTCLGYLLVIDEQTKKEISYNRIIPKAISTIFVLLCIFLPVAELLWINDNIHDALKYRVGLNEMDMALLKTPVIGYETTPQFYIHQAFNHFFTNIIIAVYAYKFQWSNTKWYTKVRKGIGYFLLYALGLSITDIHYFEWPELLPYIVMGILSYLLIKTYNTKTPINIECNSEINSSDTSISTIEINEIIKEENYTEDNCKISQNDNYQTNEKTENKDMISSRYLYCPYCGKELDPESLFCKFCGKKVSSQSYKSFGNGLLKNLNHCLKWIVSGINILYKKVVKPLLILCCIVACLVGAMGLILGYNAYGFESKENYYNIDWVYELTLCFLPCLLVILIVYSLIIWKNKQNRTSKYKILSNLTLFFSIIPIIVIVVNTPRIFDYYSRLNKEKEMYENLYLKDKDTRQEQLKQILQDIDNKTSTFSEFRYEIDRYNGDIKLLDILKQEANQDNHFAQVYLGMYYYDTSMNIDRKSYTVLSIEKRERAFYWFVKSAKGGNPIGQRLLGRCYAKTLDINSVEKDLNLAHKWWKLASEQDDADAYLYLGNLYGKWQYLSGIRVSESGERQGIDLDDNNNIQCKFNLPEDWWIDLPLARKYWQKVADLGSLDAQDALERIYKKAIKLGGNAVLGLQVSHLSDNVPFFMGTAVVLEDE